MSGLAKKGKRTIPESDILSYYFLSQLSHLLRTKCHPLEEMPKDIKEMQDACLQETAAISKRLFFYTVIICVEEAKFLPPQDESFFEHLEQRFGKNFMEYAQKNFPGKLTGFDKLDMDSGDFTRGLVSVFTFGKWSPGFGGRGWAPIASLAADYISGRISLDNFTDQAFSLCHNNGSMFNKGHYYDHYSREIYHLLDIQDSGQLPQWMNENPDSNFISPALKNVYTKAKKLFPEELGGKVNLKLVKNSEAKRAAKAQAQAANWSAWQQSQNAQAQTAKKPAGLSATDKSLLGDMTKMFGL